MKFPARIKKKLLKSIDFLGESIVEDGSISIKLNIEKEKVVGYDIQFKPNPKYLDSIGCSPSDPMSVAVESYCSAFAGILKKKALVGIKSVDTK